LKAHYPLEFMSALLTSETGNTAKVVKYISECREMNIRVLAPDVNSSEFTFTPVPTGPETGIRFGLGAIKNVGSNAVDSIAKARTEGGNFGSLYDFCERVDLGAVNRRMIESFIKAGAMDRLEGTRAQLMAVIDSAMETGVRAQKDRDSGQHGLFAGLMEEQAPSEHPLPKVPDWTSQDKLSAEKEILGFYVSGHPLDQFMDKVNELATYRSGNLEGLAKGTEVALCGILTGVLRKRNKDQKLWASMQLEDLEGAVEAMVFTTQYERLEKSLIEDKAVLVRGLVLPEENAPPKISVQDIVPLEVARISLPSLISIRVPVNGTGDADRAGALQKLFANKPGTTEVRLRLEKTRDFSVIMDIPLKVRPDKEFCAEVKRICGSESLEILAN
jgi:DNA polymerase-3 subunit alpha